MAIIIVAKESSRGGRRFIVECEKHDYVSPALNLMANAEDLARAHGVIAHNKRLRPTYHERYLSNGEARSA